MLRLISKLILKLWGWKIEGPLPTDVKKFVMAAFPHTSNWDFPLGILVRKVIGIDIKYIGKSSLFKWPYGFIFRWLGGYPVDRSRRTNFVDAVTDIFDSKESFKIVLAPEGTRRKVDQLKSGFYYIAVQAKVPIVLVKFDWSKKIVSFSEPFSPTGDIEKDYEFIRQQIKDVKGKIPEFGWPYSIS